MSSTMTWLNDPLNWTKQDGILHQLEKHVEYSAIAIGIALAVGLPLGLLLGHTNRATFLVAGANGLRALPSIGLLTLAFIALSPHIYGESIYLVSTEIVLVLLALPPILANTFAGVGNVDRAARDAAIGMGMTGRQVLFRVEFPNALPLIYSGLRSATLQVIATATIAAYIGLGGLGRFVYDGVEQRDRGQYTGGAVLVAVLALAADIVLALLQRYTVSRGITGRYSRRATATNPVEGRLAEAV